MDQESATPRIFQSQGCPAVRDTERTQSPAIGFGILDQFVKGRRAAIQVPQPQLASTSQQATSTRATIIDRERPKQSSATRNWGSMEDATALIKSYIRSPKNEVPGDVIFGSIPSEAATKLSSGEAASLHAQAIRQAADFKILPVSDLAELSTVQQPITVNTETWLTKIGISPIDHQHQANAPQLRQSQVPSPQPPARSRPVPALRQWP